MNEKAMRWQLLLPTVFALWLTCLSAPAAYDAFLKIDGIDGGSEVDGREGWIDLFSVAQGMSRSMSLVARDGASKPEFDELWLAKPVDKATPLLIEACAAGKHYPEAILDLVRADSAATRFFRVRLEDVFISRTEIQGNASDGHTLESIGLTYGYLEWSYVEFDLTGQEVAEHLAYWNLLENLGGSSVIPANGGSPTDPHDGFRRGVAFNLSGQTGAGTLSWTSESGKTYGIYYSPDLNEPFDTLVKTVPSEGDDTTSTTVDLVGSRGFFIIREID